MAVAPSAGCSSGVELHPLADPVLASARAAGLRVVLVGGAGIGELRGRADEVVAPSVPLLDVVRRLQAAGAGVALVTARDAEALAAADVGIGVLDAALTVRGGSPLDVLPPPLLPWTADLVRAELAVVPTLLSATATARGVSERGRVLALSASTLGALLLVAGPRRGSRLRAVSPVAGAALVAVATGTLAGWRAGQRAPLAPVCLVPWHNLTREDVLERLGPPEHEPLADAVTSRRGAPLLPRLVSGPTRAAAHAAAQLWHHVREELDDPLTPVLCPSARPPPRCWAPHRRGARRLGHGCQRAGIGPATAAGGARHAGLARRGGAARHPVERTAGPRPPRPGR